MLDPGEVADLEVTLLNSGGLGGTGVQALLRSENVAVTVLDSLGDYGDVPAGSTVTNSGNPFTVQADPSVAVGREIGFVLLLTGDGGYSDRVSFSLVVGEVTSTSPLGPDGYGYYAYDDTDTDYGEAPVYEWVELDPDHGGSGTLISLGTDSTAVLNLPFTFRFYGLDYNQLSVCANGWLSMGSTWITDHYNWHIPAAFGPPSLIALYWDYLDPSLPGSGAVFYHYDSSNHRLIVEWSRVLNVWELPPNPPGPGEAQTFQAILLDPSHYPTRTGDGEILCQYHTISNNDSCHNYSTVGIENEDHSDGLEYTFANIYPPAAAPLVNGRAIKFTTDPPDSFTGVEEMPSCRLQVTGYGLLQNYPNPFTAVTRIQFSLRPEASGPRAVPSGVGDQPVSLRVHDVSGRLIRTLFDETLTTDHLPLTTAVLWDGRDDEGEELPSGLYFLRISMGDFRKTRKMVLIR